MKQKKKKFGIMVLVVFCMLNRSYAIAEQEPEKAEVEGPLCSFREADGQNGYYLSPPDIVMEHHDEGMAAGYCFIRADGSQIEGRLVERGEQAVIPATEFGEGMHLLHIYLEDTEGNRVTDREQIYEFRIDTGIPQMKMEANRGFSNWYDGKCYVTVQADDHVSGISRIRAYVDGKLAAETEGDRIGFEVKQLSQAGKGVVIRTEADDYAGNKEVKEEVVYLDGMPPEVHLYQSGERSVQSKPVEISCRITDENAIQDARVKISRITPSGEEVLSEPAEWQKDGQEMSLICTLQEDGVYRITAEASDLAGHISTTSRQMIIDRTSPVISYVTALDNAYVKEFEWAYSGEEVVRDFTSCSYEVKLDGRFLTRESLPACEGKHVLSVHAVDQAGNEALAEAAFVLDRTAPMIGFQSVEEGGVYQSAVTAEVYLEDEHDHITEVRINGQIQKLPKGERVFRYEFAEPGQVEFVVSARDRAGNVAEEGVTFRIESPPTLMQKLMNPFEEMEALDLVKGRGLLHGGLAVICLVVLLVLGAVLLYMKVRDGKKIVHSEPEATVMEDKKTTWRFRRSNNKQKPAAADYKALRENHRE